MDAGRKLGGSTYQEPRQPSQVYDRDVVISVTTKSPRGKAREDCDIGAIELIAAAASSGGGNGGALPIIPVLIGLLTLMGFRRPSCGRIDN